MGIATMNAPQAGGVTHSLSVFFQIVATAMERAWWRFLAAFGRRCVGLYAKRRAKEQIHPK
jgi:hypothetical protein